MICYAVLVFIFCFGVNGSAAEPKRYVSDYKPRFLDTDTNITVTEGDTAILPCAVENLDYQSVVWLNPSGSLLFLNNRRIIDDPRLNIERPFTKDWNLHIRNVSTSDGGEYLCQISTSVKTVLLRVANDGNDYDYDDYWDFGDDEDGDDDDDDDHDDGDDENSGEPSSRQNQSVFPAHTSTAAYGVTSTAVSTAFLLLSLLLSMLLL